MCKIIALQFMSLDGVVQAPGGPQEDNSNDFQYGGWTVPYFDDSAGEIMDKQMSGDYDLLLGRKTYEIFAGYWPEHENEWPDINKKTKYVVSETLNPEDLNWQNSELIKSLDEVKNLKAESDKDLQIHGSGDLIQSLLKHDLVDELWLKTFPVILGKGKKMFGEDSTPAKFELVDSKISSKGVIFANYKKAGEVETGSF